MARPRKIIKEEKLPAHAKPSIAKEMKELMKTRVCFNLSLSTLDRIEKICSEVKTHRSTVIETLILKALDDNFDD